MKEHMTGTCLQELHQQAEGILSSFIQETVSAFPRQIVSAAATGSCLTGDYIHGKSDINSVIVVGEMTPEFLDLLASMGRRYGKKRLRAPLVMTPEYIRRSLDVFPVEFLDIKLIHKTIYGEDLFSDLAISTSLLRLQCERDLKAKLIHLHQGYISCSGGGRGLRALLIEAYPGFFPLFRAMLSIVRPDKAPSLPKASVLADIEAGFGVSMEPLRETKALAMKSGFGLDWNTPKKIFTDLNRITHELSLAVDKLSS